MDQWGGTCFDIRPSRIELGLLLCSHGVAAAAVILARLPPWLAALLLLLLSLNALRANGERGARQRLYIAGAAARLQDAGGCSEWLPVKILYRGEFMLRLRLLQAGSGQRDLLLFPDSLSTGQWRRLHRVLRFHLPGTE